MESYRVEGGHPLYGEVSIVGAKNAASKILVASLLTSDEVIVDNCPRHQETELTSEIIRAVGAQVDWIGDHTLRLHTPTVATTHVEGLSRKNRISILTLAPLLHRTGEAFVPSLGGDKIGPRPVGWHIGTLRAMGAIVDETPEGFRARVQDRLNGAIIELPYPSVGSTETAILAGVLAKGRTVIKNSAVEPEIMQLIMMLQNMGAIIQVNVHRTIEIIGVEKLHGCRVRVIPDRLEAASYACMALGTKGEVFVRGAKQEHLVSFLNMVRRIGGDYVSQEDGILFKSSSRYHGVEMETDTYPGFATDWQQPFVVLLTQADGTSVVHETVYEERFGYTAALKAMGADITLFSNCLGETMCRFKNQNHKHSAIINGATSLHAASVTVPDIRAGLAYVLAALVATGTSTLDGIEHLDRGYEALDDKLRSLGAKIERIHT